jgi:hypothetical protein
MGTKWSLLWKRLCSTLKWVLPTTLRTLKWVLPTTLRVYGLRPSARTTGSVYGLRPSGKTKGSTLTIPDLRNKLLYG